MERVMVDTRLKSKIESMEQLDETCCVKFTDLIDTFWFDSVNKLQEFLNEQALERYYDKSLRKGYFLYTNEHNETFKFMVKANRGKLELLDEIFVGRSE